MRHISKWIIVCGLLAMNVLNLSYAGGQLDKDTLETLIKGNTAEGQWVKWGTTYKMYFDPSGKYKRIDSLDNKTGAKWFVDSDGTLRLVGRKDRYRTVKQREDGGYDVYSPGGELLWTMDKFTTGDTYKLFKKH
jgi:hypothetical protein